MPILDSNLDFDTITNYYSELHNFRFSGGLHLININVLPSSTIYRFWRSTSRLLHNAIFHTHSRPYS
jgi:hypothetical protein